MANRPKGFGMTAEINAKKNSKWDPCLAADVLDWIKDELDGQTNIESHENDQQSVQNILKDGVILMRFAHALNISKAKINESKMAFKMMENIGNFLSACHAAGVNKTDSFQTVDLYEGQNMPQVIMGIHALGRKLGKIGPKEATENVRQFTQDQLRAGQNVIGLQMGSNKGGVKPDRTSAKLGQSSTNSATSTILC